MDDFPETGEIVIGKITKVLNYGVFMELIEYEGLQGFVHISNVSSSWVKNIRNFVKEGQVRAGKVISIDPEKRQLDISLTKVSPSQQRAKIEGYKQAKRAQKLIELLAKDNKVKFDIAWAEVAEPMLEKHDSLFDAFQQILINPEETLGAVGVKWRKPLQELVEKNFEMPAKTVKGMLLVSVPGKDGAESVKKALLAGEKKGGKNIEIAYEGSGKYHVNATSIDYKAAEKTLKSVCDEVISAAESLGGKASFERVSK